MTTSLEGWINENENRALVYEYIPEIEKQNKMKILCFYWSTNTWFDQNKILLPTKCIHWLTNLNFSKVISVNIYNSHFLYNQVNESHQVQIHKIIWIVQTHNKQTAMMTVLHHHILVNYTKLEDHYVIKKVKLVSQCIHLVGNCHGWSIIGWCGYNDHRSWKYDQFPSLILNK
jgi:hypothetical protein